MPLGCSVVHSRSVWPGKQLENVFAACAVQCSRYVCICCFVFSISCPCTMFCTQEERWLAHVFVVYIGLASVGNAQQTSTNHTSSKRASFIVAHEHGARFGCCFWCCLPYCCTTRAKESARTMYMKCNIEGNFMIILYGVKCIFVCVACTYTLVCRAQQLYF